MNEVEDSFQREFIEMMMMSMARLQLPAMLKFLQLCIDSYTHKESYRSTNLAVVWEVLKTTTLAFSNGLPVLESC